MQVSREERKIRKKMIDCEWSRFVKLSFGQMINCPDSKQQLFKAELSLQPNSPTVWKRTLISNNTLVFRWQCHPFLCHRSSSSASLSATKTWNSDPSISSIARFSVLLKLLVSNITSRVKLKPRVDKIGMAFVLDLVCCCSVLFSGSSEIFSLASTCSPTQTDPLHPSIRSTPSPFVYAAAVKIKRSKYMFGYRKKCSLLFMDPTFYCVTNSIIAKQQEAAFVSTVNNG